MALPALDGEWTLEDLQRLPDDGRRYEVVDGALLVMSAPVTRHDLVAKRLSQMLDAALPAELEAFSPMTLRLGRTIRVPDVVVAETAVALAGAAALAADDVLLVVEVESPSTATTDRVTKPHEYAQAGIRHYWRVEPDDAPRISTYVLHGDLYRPVGSWQGAEVARIRKPVALSLSPADLLRRR